uniref:Candidate secreted effector n=1 Tax=Meloidogyne incognita TaxID=6306 RepID=A0A914LT48_MELIC
MLFKNFLLFWKVKKIEDLEKIAIQITEHDGKDHDLQQHDNQIVEYTNSQVETNKKGKRKMNSEVGKEHDKYNKGQSSSDTPLNSKEEHHLQVRLSHLLQHILEL